MQHINRDLLKFTFLKLSVKLALKAKIQPIASRGSIWFTANHHITKRRNISELECLDPKIVTLTKPILIQFRIATDRCSIWNQS